MSEFEKNFLSKLPASDNICLFPLRLETHFSGAGNSKKLCVRIVPDEILLNYYKDGLNQEEIDDGKRFWAQWLIASGSAKREYDAWLALCAKHPVAHAAWICRNLKLQEKFYPDPAIYPTISDIESKTKSIWDALACLFIGEKGVTANSKSFNNSAENALDSIHSDLKEIYTYLGNRNKSIIDNMIVDYIYDPIFAMVDNLESRIKTFSEFYDNHPDLKKDVSASRIIKKLNELSAYVEGVFVKEYKDCRASLHSLVDATKNYLEKNKSFDECKVLPKKYFEIPDSSMLPNQFVFVGETNDGKTIRAESKVVSSKIKLSIDPENTSSYSVNGEKLEVDDSIKWMFDYSAAVDAGMAITVDVPNVTGFKYIYVFGVKSKTNKDLLSDLFNGHNYLGNSLRLLNPRTSTNVLDADVLADDEESEKEERYYIEVGKKFYLPIKRPNNDAQNISELLKVDYNNCWNRVVNCNQSSEAKTTSIYRVLWDSLFELLKAHLQDLKNRENIEYDEGLLTFIGNFFIQHVRASGNVPAIKVGNLPYGILPVSDFSKIYTYITSSKDPDAAKVYFLLKDLLQLKEKWRRLSLNVPNPSTLKGEKAEKDYLKMAGQSPYSISFIERKEISSPLIEENIPELTKSMLPNSLEDTIAKYQNYKYSILDSLFEKKFNASQPIFDTDELFDINKSRFVAALTSKGYSPEEAISYVSEFMDLFTYRVDAWLNGVLHYVITKNSANVKTQIGAYGWIFDLKEKSSSASNEDKDHFIVAPSLQHALSAAVLRSAYLKSKSSETDSHVCVNLSSMRARQALRLVDGVRSGMSMSVVLGCDLERYLHDAALHGEKDNPAEMDRFIYPLRKLFPQIVNIDAEDSRAESYAMQVVNGEALLETIINHEDWTWSCPVHEWLEDYFYDEKMAWLRDDELKMNDSERSVFFNIIERLMDSYDALNDLLLSEGVHRLVLGDQASFTAIGKFMANGEGGLPDPEILKTPSEHVVISHKAGMILPQFKVPSGKEVEKAKAFKLVDAGVDAWVESLVGGMDKICFFVKSADGKLQECTLENVGVSASDYLYLSAYPATFTNYLATRWCLINHFIGEISVLESAGEAGASCSEGHLSLEEDALRIQTIRNLLKNSHGMRPSDWISDIQEDKDDEDSIDRGDLNSRCAALVEKAQKLRDALNAWVVPNSVVDGLGKERSLKGELNNNQVDKAYGYLCDCVEFGLVNCFTGFNPASYVDGIDKVFAFQEYEQSKLAQEDLFRLVSSAHEELDKRIKECSGSVGLIKTEIEKASSESVIEAIQNLTLKNIKVFPKFKLNCKKLAFGTVNKKSTERDFSFKNEGVVNLDEFVKSGLKNYAIDENTFDQWQDEVAEVREGMKSVHNLSMVQTALDGSSLDVSIFQTTTVIARDNKDEQQAELKCLNGYWLGLPVDNEGKLRDADSLVLYNIKDYQSQNSIAGFIFDAWMEYIPYKKHSAGLVFHCDKPDAEAPQALLLAVNPKKSANWTLSSMESILKTTHEMMMSRAVDPNQIYNDPELSRIFPLFGTQFASKETV